MHRSTMAVVTQDALLVVITGAMKALNIGEEGGGPAKWQYHSWL